MEGIKQKIVEVWERLSGKIDFGDLDLKIPKFDLQSPILKLLCLVAAIFVLSFLIDYLLSRSIFGKKYRIFVAPGVVLHEISHAFFCMLTGAKIKSISLFDETGGKVEHEKSKLPVLGQILISIAPFLFGSMAIYYLSKIIGFDSISINSTEMSLGIFSSAFEDLRKLNFHSPWTWIIIYLVLSIAVTMTPSKQDFKNIALSVVVIALIAFVAFQLISYNLPNIFVPEKLMVLLSTTALLLILSLGLSIVVYVLSLGIRHK